LFADEPCYSEAAHVLMTDTTTTTKSFVPSIWGRLHETPPVHR